MKAEQLTPPLTRHGEGPVWITGNRWPDGLRWVDLLAGDVLELDTRGEVTRRHLADVVALVRPRAGGGLVYAVERGFAFDDGPGTPLTLGEELWSGPSVRMNEGGCDPAGRLYCGSMAYDARPGGGDLYRLDPDRTVSRVRRGLTIPNGLAWNATGDLAFHTDSATRRIDRYRWTPEEGLHDPRPFALLGDLGSPDGLTVDAEGGVWVAVWGAGRVHHYTPDGALADVVELPAAQVSACTFGGRDLDQLFATTSRLGLADPEPAAGALFLVRPSVSGLPARAFAG